MLRLSYRGYFNIYLYSVKNTSVVPGDVMFKLSQNNGSVMLMNLLYKKKHAIINSGIIKTKEYSSASLALESVLSIKIAENTKLACY